MQKKFGNLSKLALRQMEQEGIIHDFPQLIEKSHSPVSQAEHTIIINKNKVEVTTR
jgi:methionine aminopeptidase